MSKDRAKEKVQKPQGPPSGIVTATHTAPEALQSNREKETPVRPARGQRNQLFHFEHLPWMTIARLKANPLSDSGLVHHHPHRRQAVAALARPAHARERGTGAVAVVFDGRSLLRRIC